LSHAPPVSSSPRGDGVASVAAPATGPVRAREDPRYEKFFKQKRVGIPISIVVKNMRDAGIANAEEIISNPDRVFP
jgi:hypothetical protein